MLKIYHMPNSRSARIIWTAEELGIPYEVDLRRRSQLKLPDVLAINPMGGAPVIEDGALKMMESMAIVQYLLERHDTEQTLSPALDSPERGKYLQWFHYAEASLAPPVIAYLWSSGAFPAAPLNEAALAGPRERIRLAVGFIDDTLAASPYVAGDRFSAADIGIWWVLWLGRLVQAIDFDEFSHTAEYMARVETRPALQKAMIIPEDYVREPPGSVETPKRPRGN